MAKQRLAAVGALSAVAAVAMSASAMAKPQPGYLDRSFGDKGVVNTRVDGMKGYAASVAIGRTHRIVAAGSNTHGFLLARYEANGKLDPSFSGDGMRSVSFRDLDPSGASVAVGKGGAVTVAGVTCPPQGGCQFSVARLTADGELDQ